MRQLLDKGRKGFTRGTHRLVSPAETLRRFLPTARRLGVTRLADVTGLDRIGIPVVMAVRPASRSLSVSQGKGPTLEAAKVSAMMESLELYHGENIALPTRLASLSELRGEGAAVIDVEPMALAGFDPRRRILWLEGTDLLSEETCRVPLESVQTDTVLDELPGAGSFAVTSNGLASGNHLTEATVHALCELVERDALTRWHRLGSAARAETCLRPGSVDDPVCLDILGRFKAAEVEVRSWHLGSELDMPAYLTHIVDRSGSPWPCPGIFAGIGCHLDAGVALLRSLTEAAQSRLTVISGARDDLFRGDLPRGDLSHEDLSHGDHEDAESQEATLPDAEPRWDFVPRRATDSFRGDLSLGDLFRGDLSHGDLSHEDLSHGDHEDAEFQDATWPDAEPGWDFVPRRATDSFRGDLDEILGRLEGAGHGRVVRIDLSRPELGIPVVRMVVPGLLFDETLI